jgi:SAM-dependent methyltransferase
VIFDVADDAYERFMGRYSTVLGPVFADFAAIEPGLRVLDVGAGTGALTAELVRRVGAEHVSAAEPSARFVEGMRERFAGVEVVEAPAEELPWPDDTFDAALAQLVISFVSDGPAAARELRRVVRPGGVVAFCTWDPDGMEMLAAIARARRAVDPNPVGDEPLKYRTRAEIDGLLEGAGLRDVETGVLEVAREFSGYDELWSALLGAVGPAGRWVVSLDDDGRAIVRAELHRELGSPEGAFTLRAQCNAGRGLV